MFLQAVSFAIYVFAILGSGPHNFAGTVPAAVKPKKPKKTGHFALEPVGELITPDGWHVAVHITCCLSEPANMMYSHLHCCHARFCTFSVANPCSCVLSNATTLACSKQTVW